METITHLAPSAGQLGASLLTYIADAVTGDFVVVILTFSAVVVALLQFIQLRKNTEAENERKRREYALSYSLTRTNSHVEARQSLAEIFGPTTKDCDALSLETIDAAIDADKAVLTKIRLLLNHWENMGLSIFHGVADEDTAFEMVSQRVINTVHQYENYINRVHDASPVSYKYLIWLANRWSRREPVNTISPALKLKRPRRRKLGTIEPDRRRYFA